MILNEKIRQWAKSVEPGAEEKVEHLKKTEEYERVLAAKIEKDRSNRRYQAALDYQKRQNEERESLIQHLKRKQNPDITDIYLIPKQ